MLSKLTKLLNDIRGKPLSRQQRIKVTTTLAQELLNQTLIHRTPAEAKKDAWLGKLMEDPAGRYLLTEFADIAFRGQCAKRIINQLCYLLHTLSIPKCLSDAQQLQLHLLSTLGPLFPRFFLKQIQKQILGSLKGILLFGSAKQQSLFFQNCRQTNIQVNLNHLGEAILGENEAKLRIEQYLQDLQEDEVDYISVKVSTLFSQIQLTAWDSTLAQLKQQLRRLYRQAKSHQFVNLDMEEYQDLDLTIALFTQVLDEPEFAHVYAGIALQAYLPDSYPLLKQLALWAQKRKTPIRVRLVKGANIPMEQIHAEIKNWKAPTYTHKWETDANFKRLLEYALQSQFSKCLHIGVASHNIFDIAYALVLRSEAKAETRVHFEMLSGMATALQRILCELTGALTLYCPEANAASLEHAIGYLIRRFDENGSPQNFMRHFFQLQPGNFLWQQEEKRFYYSCSHLDEVSDVSFRLTADVVQTNEPTIDFSLSVNRQRLNTIYSPPKIWEDIPLVIGETALTGSIYEGVDPSLNQVIYRYHGANEEQIDLAFNSAVGGVSISVFEQAAHLMRQKRDALLQALIADGGKTLLEADAEISEAIDFICYYSKQWLAKGSAKGVILVASPWNFPAAIATGGIVAALVTGNAVLFKPASATVLVGWEIAKIFWEAGVSQKTLQFIPCPQERVKNHILKHPKLSGVILTGATQTAKDMLQINPKLYLMAETGGKNAIIVTAMADHDLAVRDLISSAFGHSGQKCSACSLGILEKQVYQNRHFLEHLRDAASSLHVGSCWDPKTKLGPLIHPPNEKLLRALTSLEEGESWLLEPKKLTDNLWSAGIKLGVKSNSFFHQTECFGPVLGLVQADDLKHALELANGTPYGLTAGLHSLDPREQTFWKKHIVAGNLYINRNITGAVVGRQPFGGCKESSFGPGRKAGGPLYCDLLVNLTDECPQEKGVLPQAIVPLMRHLSKLSAEEKTLWKQSVESYAYWASKYQYPQELAKIKGQQNLYYMVPKSHLIIRYNQEPLVDLLRVLAACLICKTPFTLSSVNQLDIECVVETQEQCFKRKEQLRLLSPLLFHPGCINTPVFASGKFEILHYLREISLSFDYHRYGYFQEKGT